jgi:glyoxylase-like metal-dependent hydrolase (beta-lactamase superfamily II)
MLNNFMINKIKENVWQLHFKEFGSCVYLIKLKELILIDTSSKECRNELLSDLKELKIKPEEIKIIILTHDHYDHIENNNLFTQAKIYSKRKIGQLNIPEFKFINAPGHSKEDICILYRNILFSGDVIFHNGYIGRTDFPESNPKKMQESLEKLKKIKFEILCPGHLF